jgi:hypothetical protein
MAPAAPWRPTSCIHGGLKLPRDRVGLRNSTGPACGRITRCQAAAVLTRCP